MAGIKVNDRNQAQQIPKARTIPYPFMPVRGEKINVKKANEVVIDVNVIGKTR